MLLHRAPCSVGLARHPSSSVCATHACPYRPPFRSCSATEPRSGAGCAAACSTRRTVTCAATPDATFEAKLMAEPGLKIGVIVSRFNSLITKGLLEGAEEAFHKHGVAGYDVVWVPGSFELPLVAASMAKSGSYSAVLCIGAVIRGSTAHYDAVVSATTSGILNAGLTSGIPVIFGVLTCDTLEQALDRTGGKIGNKGYECAATAVEMANLLKSLQDQKKGVAGPWK